MGKRVNRPPIEELREHFVGKRVVDKNGIKATVTDMRELTNRHPDRSTPVQVTLNKDIRMSWQQFGDIRKFRVIEGE